MIQHFFIQKSLVDTYKKVSVNICVSTAVLLRSDQMYFYDTNSWNIHKKIKVNYELPQGVVIKLHNQELS